MIDRSHLAASVAAVLAAGTFAWATEPVQQDSRIKELESKVAALETQQVQNSKDLATTIDAVLRDAEKRSKLLANGGESGAGYDNGFYIKSGDAWILKPGLQFQFRNVTNYRDEVGGSGGEDDLENGFEVRRMKFYFEGTAVTKQLTYLFQWETLRKGGGVRLQDAWARYMLSDDWGFRLGQFKDPVHHEELTSSKRQLAADRSLLNELLGGGFTDYTQGVSLIYGGYAKTNALNVEVAFTDGLNEDNTNFIDKTAAGLAGGIGGGHFFDYGIAGRIEWKLSGDWSSYRDFSAMGNKDDLFVLGAGGDWSQSGDGDVLVGTVDAQWENNAGLGAYGALLCRNTPKELSGTGDDQFDWGVLAQVGYMLNPAWEIFARYDVTVFDENQVLDEDTFHEVTVGFNYFLGTNGSAGHRAKFTVDLTYLPNGSPVDDDGLGILDATDGEDEWILRAQFQLLV